VEGGRWKGGRVEGWKDGKVEGWKVGRWKDGKVEGVFSDSAIICEATVKTFVILESSRKKV
jgi:hypothetical protein